MKKKKTDIDTFVIGPSCCGGFVDKKDLCHICIARGYYTKSICFLRPSGSIRTVREDEERLRTAAEIIGRRNP